MSLDLALRLAYGFNIAVLLPVILSLFGGGERATLAAFEDKAANVDALRLLVASLWSAVVLLSLGGLICPRAFVALLLFQVVYKAIWLASFAVPAWRGSGAAMVPVAMSTVFLFIVVIWPWLIAATWRTNASASQ